MVQMTIGGTKTTVKTNVLIAIRLEWAYQILSGNKRWEYRRISLKDGTGGRLLLYASGNMHAIVGEATIERIINEPVELLIEHTIKEVPETADDLRKSFAGRTTGCAIKLKYPIKYNVPITLQDIRNEIPGFMPPQGFYYVLDQDPLIGVIQKR